MTFRRRARTKQLKDNISAMKPRRRQGKGKAYYARGKDKPIDAMTSAMQMVADLETPTRQ
jgi:hypothetical protein